MIQSIELQVISRILTSEDEAEIEELLRFDPSYYSIFKPQIEFILDHRDKYQKVPDRFTFQVEFPDTDLVDVREPMEFLVREMKRNKQANILRETFNTVKDLAPDEVEKAWDYIAMKYEEAESLKDSNPMDIIKESQRRSEQITEYSKQARIPTGFPEIDEVMYGGLSTVEELCIIFARMNTGKSWMCAKMMESAQRHGFPVLYYSPEMQPCYLATRFDTWRGGFYNSEIMQGRYDDKYKAYLSELVHNDVPAYVLEDADSPSGTVNVPLLVHYVRKYKIKLLIIDGLSYMEDVHAGGNTPDHIKYKDICLDLFKLSKRYGCAVVIAMQANRETKNNVEKNADGKEPMPGMHNLESSDHPGRIATTAIALRQIWASQTLDLKIQKSRNSKRPDVIYTYSWDPNSGYLSLKGEESASGNDGGDSAPMPAANTSFKSTGYAVSPMQSNNSPNNKFISAIPADGEDYDARDDEEVEF